MEALMPWASSEGTTKAHSVLRIFRFEYST
ncbi:hypothetical protein IMSAGC003_03587 [Lachnospiraceae bacterium]|nr:hypothetical protein IMSAGC003_03587 [Lachnospiraceae bacterium]